MEFKEILSKKKKGIKWMAVKAVFRSPEMIMNCCNLDLMGNW